MKKILYTLMALAVAATTMVSCNKREADSQVPAEGYRYSFSVINDDTRATLDNQGVLWEAQDKVGMFLDGYTGYANLDVTTTPKSVVLYSQQAIPADSYAYAYYPYSTDNNSSDDKELAKIVVSNIQDGGSNSAMPMAGIPLLIEEAVPVESGSARTNGQIKFLNLGSIIDFKVYSADYSDETVQYVQFQVNDEHVVSGDFYMDLTAVDPTDETTLEIECMSLGVNEYDYVKRAPPPSIWSLPLEPIPERLPSALMWLRMLSLSLIRNSVVM